ncbi:MAG: hypothetical protein DRQ37_00695, partial [Gammaproteobacteria bacterium]
MERANLDWVHDEIAASLKQARIDLEQFAEGIESRESIEGCASALHGVHGVLEMLELYGVSLLTEEMDALTQGLLDERVERREEACELLMRAIVQLPEYLDYLRAGNRDNPALLLSLLNDLRSIRGQPLLSQHALFAPDLSADIPLPTDRPIPEDSEIKSFARGVRPHFQKALVTYMRGPDHKHGLDLIRTVIVRLETVSGPAALNRLWWVARGVVEALDDGGLEGSNTITRLLGRIDGELKKLAESGVQGLSSFPPADLMRDLLYFVARSNSVGERVSAVRAAFALEDLLIKEGSEGDLAELSGPNLEAMHSVAEVLKEELAQVRDALDTFARNEEAGTEELEAVTETLRRMADTLGLLGLGIPRKALLERVRAFGQFVESGTRPDEQELMDTASVLIHVESTLDAVSEEGAEKAAASLEEAAGTDAGEEGLTGIEYLNLVTTVISEAKANLNIIKDALDAFAKDLDQREGLAAIPNLAEQVEGGLKMLSLEKPARYLEHWRRFVDRVIVNGEGDPGVETLDVLADVLAGIEYCLEAVAEMRKDPEAILGFVEQRIGLLEIPPDVAEEQDQPEAVPEGDEAVDQQPQALPEVTVEDIEAEVEEFEAPPPPPEEEVAEDAEPLPEATVDDFEVEVEEVTLEAAPGEDQLPEDEVADEAEKAPADGMAGEAALPDSVARTLQQAQDTLKRMEDEPPPAESVAADEGAALTAEPPADAVDEEILEIFIEEAGDVLESFSEMVPRWAENPEDEEALSTIRRGFHTLKGSGRLVGANRIGEFAWSVENMLNRLIEGLVTMQPTVAALVEDACQALGPLVDELKGEGEATVDLAAIAGRAEALAAGAEVGAAGVAQSAASEAETETEIDTQAAEASADRLAFPASGPADGPAEIDEPQAAEFAEESDVIPAATLTPSSTVIGESEEMQELFLDEASEILGSFDEILQRWTESPGAENVIDELQRELHTLKGGARMVGLMPLGDISHDAESLLKRVTEGELAASEELVDLIQIAYDRINEMLDLVRAGRKLEAAEDLSAQLAGFGQDGGEEMIAESASETLITADAGLPDAGDAASEEPVPRSDQTATTASFHEDDEIRELFLEEAVEILESTDGLLEGWQESRDDTVLIDSLQRELHTLKGGSRMAGLYAIGDLSHAMESTFKAVSEDGLAVSDEIVEQIQNCRERIGEMLDIVRTGRTPEKAEELIAHLESLRTGQTPAPAESAPADAAEVAAPQAATAVVDSEDKDSERRRRRREQEERIPVASGLLDHLVNSAGELGIMQSRVERQVTAFRLNLEEFQDTVRRLHDQMRRLEMETESQILYRHERTEEADKDKDFDPLELDRFSQMQQLTRGLTQSIGDLSSLHGILTDLNRDAEAILIQQARLNTDLQQGLLRSRMVPFSSQQARFERIVRKTARDLGKEAALRMSGGAMQLDRTPLNRMVAPLEHMLRNAVSHGLESPEERSSKGKPRAGTIDVRAYRDGAEMVIEVEDDGRGMNRDAIRQRAIERKLMKETDELADEELFQFVFEPAFSTATEVSHISGRGVGMDVVQTETKRLGGTLRVSSEVGKGTTISVRLPVTLAISRALLVHTAGDNFAIRLTAIDAVVRLSAQEAKDLLADEAAVVEHGGERYPFAYLGKLLGFGNPHLSEDIGQYPAVLARVGDTRMALLVDRLIGRQEIVLKPLGPQLGTVRWLTGGTILGDGSVVLVLDIPALLRLGIKMRTAAEEVIPESAAVVEEKAAMPVVMVVDDSITVRKVTERLLKRNGMEVVTAKDGLDALALLQDQRPVFMLLDIEMPRFVF